MILGSPLGFAAAKSGIIIFIVFLFFNLYSFKKNNSKFARDASPWLSMGWFSVLFALITSIGRAGFAQNTALASRYITVSTLLVIACLQMSRLFICYQELESSKNTYRFLDISFIVGFITGILIIPLISSYNNVLGYQQQAFLNLTSGKTCLEVIHFLDASFDEPFNILSRQQRHNHCLQYVYHLQPGILRKQVEKLEQLGFRYFPREIAFTTNPIPNYGNIQYPPPNQTLTLSKNNSVKIRGWTILPEHHQRPEVVLLSYGKQRSFFASAIIKIAQANNKVQWEAKIEHQSLPAGETIIKAWVYDRHNKQFVMLNGNVKVAVLN